MMWIVLGTGLAAAVLVLAITRYRGDHDDDLGSVSHNWIAEQGTSRDS